MRKFGVNVKNVAAVLITHMHGDHFFDFPALLWAMAADGRKEPLAVFGPQGIAQAIDFLREGPLGSAFMPRNFVLFPFDVHEMKPGDSFSVGKLSVATAMGEHPVPDVAYRISDGNRTVTFSGDTGPSKSVAKLAQGSDLLVHESTFLRGEEAAARITGHSTALEAGQVAAEAGVRLLLLNHVAPRLSGKEDEMATQASEGGIKALVAYDGLCIHLE